MRVAVFGPSGVGKTTLTRILSRALCHKLNVIHGDRYIRQKTEDWNRLRAALAADSFIFDHISSPTILQHCGITPDLAIAIRNGPGTGDTAGSERGDSADNHYHKQLATARALSKVTIEVDSVRDALKMALDHFQARQMFPDRLECFIVKIAARCNLNCSYCYMYQANDQSYHALPAVMATTVATQLGFRLAQHLDTGRAERVDIILHGGEPMMVRPDAFRSIVSAMQNELAHRSVRYSIQTNGTRITDEYLHILDEYGIDVGISLDGEGAFANRFREYHSGAPAYQDILEGIQKCLHYRFQNASFGGVLCVVDPQASGKSTYRYLRSLGLHKIDFLLRDETHDFAPGGRSTHTSAAGFLCDAFDEWLADPEPCDVRLFNVLIGLRLGASYSTDSYGLYPYNALGVGVSGGWELLDILRICWPDAWKTPYSVHTHSIADVISSPELKRLYRWQYDLADTCMKCRYLITCGGGYLPHRFSNTQGFRNPSSHCAALFMFLEHIERRLHEAGALGSPSSTDSRSM